MDRKSHSRKGSAGFTLIELLVVIAIIGILAAAGAVGYQNYTNDARINSAEKINSDILSYMHTVRATAMGGLTLDTSISNCDADDADCVTQLVAKLTADGYQALVDGAARDAGDTEIVLIGGVITLCTVIVPDTAASPCPAAPVAGTQTNYVYSTVSGW